MSIGTTGQQTQQQLAHRFPLQHHRKLLAGPRRRPDDVVAGTEVGHHARIPDVPVDGPRLVLLVVVDPQLHSRLSKNAP